jgi:hypothetical protein
MVLVGVALVCEIAGDDDEVGRGRVDLLDCGAEKLLAITAPADVDVGELSDQHRHSLTRPRWPRPAVTGTPQPAHAVEFRNSTASEIGQIHPPDRIYDPYAALTLPGFLAGRMLVPPP